MTIPIANRNAEKLKIGRTLRLSTFQIGSAMGEILTASVWNRVMISDLGMPATPVGLLLALQYLLMPISLYVGHRSDRLPLFGRYRSSYIWLGRATMLVAFPLLALSVQQFDSGTNGIGWLLATIAFLLFGVGKLASGSVYLALVRDSAPPSKQGIAIGVAETMLIALFPVVAIAFGRWMEQYDPAVLWQLVWLTTAVGGFFWWFAVVRVEAAVTVSRRRNAENRGDLRRLFDHLWQDKRTRAFFYFLALSKFMAWMQDNILEPFGGDVFGLGAGVTTRFTGYWGTTTVIVLVGCFWWFRQQKPEAQRPVTAFGLAFMAVGMVALAAASMLEMERLITLSLAFFGAGFGAYTFGALSLMAVMSPGRNAGAYLGLWTICILVSKGLGTFAGGVLRDLFLLVASPAVAYGLIFVIAAVGLVAAGLHVLTIDIASFVKDHE